MTPLILSGVCAEDRGHEIEKAGSSTLAVSLGAVLFRPAAHASVKLCAIYGLRSSCRIQLPSQARAISERDILAKDTW